MSVSPERIKVRGGTNSSAQLSSSFWEYPSAESTSYRVRVAGVVVVSDVVVDIWLFLSWCGSLDSSMNGIFEGGTITALKGRANVVPASAICQRRRMEVAAADVD